MKKKYFGSLLTFMMVAILCVGFVSCGSDDEEEASSGKDNNTLVGGWMDSDLYMVLLTDGKMFYYKTNELVNEGNWNYNEQTGILATDVDKYQWSINLITENSWAGIRLWNQKTTTAQRNIVATAGILLAGRTWTFNEIKKNYSFHTYRITNKGFQDNTPYVESGSEHISLTDVSEDRSKDVITVKYNGGIYEIHHPYNYDSIYLLFPSGNKYYPKK